MNLDAAAFRELARRMSDEPETFQDFTTDDAAIIQGLEFAAAALTELKTVSALLKRYGLILGDARSKRHRRFGETFTEAAESVDRVVAKAAKRNQP